MDKIVNRNDKRKVMIISEEPFKKEFLFNIPTTSNDVKEISNRKIVEIKEIKFDLLPQLLDFEKEMSKKKKIIIFIL
jgi:hypothetical protein